MRSFNMAVTSRPMPDTAQPVQRSTRPRIGFLRPGHIERAFITLLYVTLLALVALSVIGTFYGWQGRAAPLMIPIQIWRDIIASTAILWVAIGVQAALTLAQYGARQMARHDPRWWFLYLAALGISVYYNVQAYWMPLTEMIPFYVAALLILAGDILPEFLAVRHD